MKEQSSRKLSVFNFLDILQYLQAYFHMRKSTEEGFSYEAWASELGFKSRSNLRMIFMGQKKVSDGFCIAFCKANGFKAHEEEYFHVLAKYSQASTPLEKKTFGLKLVQILKLVSDRVDIDNQVEFVTKPLYVRLLTLLSFEDLEKTAVNLATLLGAEIPEVQEALEKLQAMGLANPRIRAGDPLWETTHERFRVPDNMGSVPMMRFHEQSLLESIQAFHKPKNERRYKSLLLPLTPEELAEFHQMMDNFAAEQLARFQSNQYEGRRLYQVNLNVHSVAKDSKDL